MNILPNLPEDSRIWIYTSNREFKDEEITQIQEMMNNFISSWNVHGKKLQAGFEVLYNQFIVLAVNEDVASASGCSIDSSVAIMKSLEKQFNVSLLDKLNLAYHSKNNKIAVLPMFKFQQEMDNKNITEQTIVFNNLIETLAELRTSWEVPLKDSWHKQLL